MSNATNFAAALAAEGFAATPETPKATGLTKLEGNDSTRKAGDFVLAGQPLATDEGFRNVSKIWYDKTLTFEQALEKIAAGRAQTQDIECTVKEMIPTVHKGQFAFLHRPTESYFVPTEHAMGQVGHWADTGTWFVQNMLVNPLKPNGQEKYKRDDEDFQTLARVIANGFRRLDQGKKFLFRTRKDGTLRAMLTDRYAVVDNTWFLLKLREFIPGGRVSHWRGDSDTLFTNILIPDSIREEKDSEYGGMLSIGNSEIGERRVSSRPSIFRAICMNGCIWGQTKGKGIKQVHRGKINLDSLALEIKQNLNDQIPLTLQGIDKLLGTRILAWDGCSIKPVIAEVAKERKFTKKEASDILSAWNTEKKLTPDLGYTLFGVVNAITRAAQEQEPAKWVDFDSTAGEFLDYDADDFSRMINRAKALDTEEVDEMFTVGAA